jgi:hypothetical protein
MSLMAAIASVRRGRRTVSDQIGMPVWSERAVTSPEE